ncbi:hypothetical protein AKJ43_01955 [candidate division MSBL1 archaeon SCGC-AAA261D19]|uniref:Uncharacterized protein n=1 Tax=candidate division MSBL1 archaeon SCGC-AAA261D19 TaxID=1698273 RepID=A0A133V7E0_9EURY|nr:hypothetical protein AKJ43_01955 [candidate division MSBL1 archaeon SCGC-AAA261D19]
MEKVVIKTNLLPPIGKEETFVKRVKYWLINRCKEVPLDTGDSFLIRPDILTEFGAQTYYSFEDPSLEVVATEGESDRITKSTTIELRFRPTKLKHQRKDIILEGAKTHNQLDTQELFKEFVSEELDMTIHEYNKMEKAEQRWINEAFQTWIREKRELEEG